MDKQAEIIQKKLPKIYSKELVELLFMNPYTKIKFLEKHLGVIRQTASKYLKQLYFIDLLEEQKIGKANYYINKEFVEVLSK